MTFNGALFNNYNNLEAVPTFRYNVVFPGGPGLWLKQQDCVQYGAPIGDMIIRICDEFASASLAAAIAEADGAVMEEEEHAVDAIVGARFSGGELYVGVLWHGSDQATWEKAVNCGGADVSFNEFIEKLCAAQ